MWNSHFLEITRKIIWYYLPDDTMVGAKMAIRQGKILAADFIMAVNTVSENDTIFFCPQCTKL